MVPSRGFGLGDARWRWVLLGKSALTSRGSARLLSKQCLAFVTGLRTPVFKRLLCSPPLGEALLFFSSAGDAEVEDASGGLRAAPASCCLFSEGAWEDLRAAKMPQAENSPVPLSCPQQWPKQHALGKSHEKNKVVMLRMVSVLSRILGSTNLPLWRFGTQSSWWQGVPAA